MKRWKHKSIYCSVHYSSKSLEITPLPIEGLVE
jgi:hypothetical protein